jgi:hypothetical protein
MNKNYKISSIFNKIINNKYKLVSFNKIENAVGNTKYFPAASKEWTNSVYYYNNNNMKNLPSYDINLNNLIKSYFNLYFNNKFLNLKKGLSRRSIRLSFNKIFLSKAEIKHTSSKAIITLYTYNREKIALEKNIRMLKKSFFNKVLFFINKSNNTYKNVSNNAFNKFLKHNLNQELMLIRRYKLKLSLNKYKFQELFLFKLSNIISRIYNKKVEFNIINLRSILFNSDIFTNVLTLKIRKKKTNVLKAMNSILNRTMLPKVNRIIERSRLIKNIDFNIIENKYKNLNLNYLLKNSGLDYILNGIYTNSTFEKNFKKLYDTIFNSIKYKNMAGIRLEVKGRLTKRYRADRAVLKVRWKGGLKNIDSSYKGLSTVNLRGYSNPNVEYSIRTSKRRIGAFAVKGWISGK